MSYRTGSGFDRVLKCCIVRLMPGVSRVRKDGAWEIRESLQGGSATRSYCVDGHRATRVEIAADEARQVTGLKLIEKDLRTLKIWLGLAKAETSKIPANAKQTFMPDGHQVYSLRALMIAICTTYGKLFTNADGRRVRLAAKDVPAEFATLHASLMDMRHQFAAHAGVGHETCRAILAVDPWSSGPSRRRVFVELNQPAVWSPETLGEIEKLVEGLHSRVLGKFEAAAERLAERAISLVDEDELRRRKRNAQKRARMA